MITVNNLQAGRRIKNRRLDERRRAWANAQSDPPAGVADSSCTSGSVSPTLMVCLRPSHTVSCTTCFIQRKKQPRLRATGKLTEYSGEATGERRFLFSPQVDCSRSIFIRSSPTSCKWHSMERSLNPLKSPSFAPFWGANYLL